AIAAQISFAMATNCSCGIKQQKSQYHCRGQIEAIMRPYIMIVVLPVFGMLALVYTARTPDRTYAGLNCAVDCSGREAGYRWAEQHSIDDEDYCPDGDSESFYEGCIAYVRGIADQADNGIGVGTPINPDADDGDYNK
ncbi:MAG: hypothetical protein WAN27_09270, partial [Xanthobacteraceae bacterium]